MSKHTIAVTDYDLLHSILNDASIDANKRACDAEANDSKHAAGLEHLATSIQKLLGEVTNSATPR